MMAPAPSDQRPPQHSARGSLCVYDYSPVEGSPGLQLTVHIEFNPQPSCLLQHAETHSPLPRPVIVLGGTVLKTNSFPMSSPGAGVELSDGAGLSGNLRLCATIPPRDSIRGSPLAASVSIHVLQDTPLAVLDTVELGSFTYVEHDAATPSGTFPALRVVKRDHGSMEGSEPDHRLKRIAYLHNDNSNKSDHLYDSPNPETYEPPLTAVPPNMLARVTPPESSRAHKSRRSKKSITLIRTTQLPPVNPAADQRLNGLSQRSEKVTLVVKGDLQSVTKGWTAEDYETHRRLIQFRRQQRGSIVNLHFEPVPASDFRDYSDMTPTAEDPPSLHPSSPDADQLDSGSAVVSCIQHPHSGECYITSVDIISLLEIVVGNSSTHGNPRGIPPSGRSSSYSGFTVEEKNRIRRNLEGFKPRTVSKSKPGTQGDDFFGLIMGFSHPKPRNIEKDVKVFPWKQLQPALEKILSKYSYIPESDGHHNNSDSTPTDGSSPVQDTFTPPDSATGHSGFPYSDTSSISTASEDGTDNFHDHDYGSMTYVNPNLHSPPFPHSSPSRYSEGGYHHHLYPSRSPISQRGHQQSESFELEDDRRRKLQHNFYEQQQEQQSYHQQLQNHHYHRRHSSFSFPYDPPQPPSQAIYIPSSNTPSYLQTAGHVTGGRARAVSDAVTHYPSWTMITASEGPSMASAYVDQSYTGPVKQTYMVDMNGSIHDRPHPYNQHPSSAALDGCYPTRDIHDIRSPLAQQFVSQPMAPNVMSHYAPNPQYITTYQQWAPPIVPSHELPQHGNSPFDLHSGIHDRDGTSSSMLLNYSMHSNDRSESSVPPTSTSYLQPEDQYFLPKASNDASSSATPPITTHPASSFAPIPREIAPILDKEYLPEGTIEGGLGENPASTPSSSWYYSSFERHGGDNSMGAGDSSAMATDTPGKVLCA